jgi:hypothetical protein
VPTPIGLARSKALELLADGEWHNYRTTLREIASAVPPGVAIRRTERARKRRVGAESTRKYRANNNERLIEIGALSIARDVIADASWFEIEPRGTQQTATKKIRLIPAKVPPKGVQGDGQQMGEGLRPGP